MLEIVYIALVIIFAISVLFFFRLKEKLARVLFGLLS